MKLIYLNLLFSFIFFASYNPNSELKKFFLPPNIKTIIFKNNDTNSKQFPVLRLNNTIKLSFDDINADELDYYYKITYHNSDWTESILSKNEYLIGYDNLRISNYQNSFNTIQTYTNYTLILPNESTRFKLSGNYMIHIYNLNGELQFSRKFIFVKEKIKVSANVYRTRDLNFYQTHQSIKFSISQPSIGFLKNIETSLSVVLIQNDQWNNSISGFQPQYQTNNVLEYRYEKETRFPGGNEYFYFDTKDLRITGPNISYVSLNKLYESYLYTDIPRKNLPYSYGKDINGDFEIRTLMGTQNESIEADYSWINFTLAASVELPETEVFILGKFNNYEPRLNNKMFYNNALEAYEARILLKQGFYNYKYVALTPSGFEYNLISGDFAQTENSYTILVYYRAPGEIFDELIGITTTSSLQIFN